MNIIYKGRGFFIVERGEKLQVAFQEGIESKTVYYDVSRENALKAMKSEKDADEVLSFAKTGYWPATEEQQLETARELVRRHPDLLLVNDCNKSLFTQEELEELMNKLKEKQS